MNHTAATIMKGFVVLAACLLMTCGAGYLLYQNIMKTQRLHDESAIRLHMASIQDGMQLELGRVSNSLSYLVDQVEVHHTMRSSSDILSADFLSFVKTSSFFDQVRLIDMSGHEVIRANYNRGHPRLVSKDALQNKADRYYFREGVKLKRGDIYISPFDLNVEHGKIEQPIKPTIRMVQLAFDADGRPIGMVVVNVLGHSLLALVGKESKAMRIDHVSLLNRDGYWLSGPNNRDLWAFMYPGRESRSLANRFPEVWRQIRDRDQARVRVDGGVYLSSSFYPIRVLDRLGHHVDRPEDRVWKLVAFYPDTTLAAELAGQRRIITFSSAGSGIALAIILLGTLRLLKQSKLRRMAEVRVREQALESEKSKAIMTIAGGMGHEFNNILTSILGSAYLLRTKLADQPDLQRKVEAIEKSGKRAAQLVRYLMTFAQVDILENRPLLLNEVVASQVEEMRRTLPERVVFEATVAEVPMRLCADQDKLEAVVQNLLSNAVDAVVDGDAPRIVLSLQMSDETPAAVGEGGRRYACLTVQDNGCGIASGNMPYIFDPFFTTKAPGSGTGLGLALVYGAVRALHGEVRVESAEGAGTTIRVLLPLEEDEPLRASSEA